MSDDQPKAFLVTTRVNTYPVIATTQRLEELKAWYRDLWKAKGWPDDKFTFSYCHYQMLDPDAFAIILENEHPPDGV